MSPAINEQRIIAVGWPLCLAETRLLKHNEADELLPLYSLHTDVDERRH